MLRILYRFC